MSPRTSRKQLIMKRVVFDFHPMWFASTMGTGISSTVLYNFPYEARWLKVCSYIMFAVCVLLFLFFNALMVASAVLYPRKMKNMLLNVSQSVFFGCYSMGFSSIISYLHNITGKDWVTALFVLWVINIGISLFSAWIVTFLIHWKADIQPHEIHISYLLPVVSQNVVAAIGGVLYDTLHPNLKLPNIIISFLCWSNGIALTGWIVGVYMWKLYVHKIPLGKNNGFVAFLPIGAFGQGSYAAMLICDNLRHYLQVENPAFLDIGVQGLEAAAALPDGLINVVVGQSVRYLGLMTGLFLVANGYFFTFSAVCSLWAAGVSGFSKAWWSCTFPLGTMALSNHALYSLFGLRAFRVVSAVYLTVLVLITTSCIVGSLVWEFPHEVYKPIDEEEPKKENAV